MAKISIKKIAELAEVSKTTVSFVLNGRGDEKNISKATQDKITAIAKENQYQANHIARSLSIGKSFTIGFIVPDISNPFYGKIARHIEQFAEDKGYSVMVASTNEDLKKEKKIIDQFKARQVDGIILASSAPNLSTLNITLNKNLPTVLFDRVFKDSSQSFVDINNEEAAMQLTETLINKGHSRIAFFSTTSYLPNISDRTKGYKAALEKNGITYDSKIHFEIDFKNKKEEIVNAFSSLMNTEDCPTAILFVNNVLASEALWCVNTNFAAYKDQLSFACFDNLDLFDYSLPKVSSVIQPSEEIANQSVFMLCKQIEDTIDKEGIQLKTKIINR
ncbi:LacI family DNA-binding transcriptional regulator [Saccharicrinis aurantiacus]|uniref:LacI family DNA-binding transcriptional regulator n=1 Tax=Saccharicrinis aurantiacus TaxID=1849719 RepID=UPI002493613C|nr:LacI family DNA-binding transcriptional regulator [Saccharicrinis aurantiacus]